MFNFHFAVDFQKLAQEVPFAKSNTGEERVIEFGHNLHSLSGIKIPGSKLILDGVNYRPNLNSQSWAISSCPSVQ